MEIIKFFKDAKGLWHVNNTIMPSGKLALRQITDTTVVMTWLSSIGVNQNNNKFFEGEITDIKREDGTSYATITEFLTECGDFFVNASQGGANADNELQTNIDAEAQTRINADAALQANIDALDSNVPISVTYEELKTLKDASQLVPLQTYLLTDYRTTYHLATDYQLDSNGYYYQTLEPMGGIVGEISNVSNQDGTVRTITLINGGSDYIDGSYTLDGGNYGCQYNIVAENGVVTGVSLVDGGSLYYDGEYSIPGGNNDAIIQVSVGYKTYQIAENTNPLEPLIITAAGTNSLETICKSTIYGQDIIYYNIDDNSEGFTKGKIYRRIDTIQNNDIGTDWRHIKYRRWKLNVTNDWVNGQVYNRGDIVKNGTSIYMCYRTTELWNASLYNFIQLGFNNGDYAGMYTNYNNIYLGINIYDSFDDTYFSAAALSDDYRDTLMFTEYGSAIVNNKFETKYLHNSVFIGNNFYSNTVGNNFNSNTVGNNFYSNTVGNDFNLNIVGSYFNSNTVENNFNSNTIGNNFYFNTVGMSFNSNIIETNFYSNTVGSYFQSNAVSNFFYFNTVGNSSNYNIIGNNFQSNTMENGFQSNTVGNNFNSNTVGNNFNSNTVGNYSTSNAVGNNFNYNTVGSGFYSNTVENDFQYNTVGNNFQYNTVGSGFYSNTVGNDFQYNTVGSDFQSNTVGNDFYFNTVGNNFYSNTIGNNFNSNTVGNNFYFNTIGNYFQYNTVFENISNKDFLTIGELYTKTYNHKLTSTPNKVKIEWVDNYGDTNIERI